MKTDPTGHRASYGAIDYRAPEVDRGDSYTAASDVFSYGVVACRMMECRLFTCQEAPSESVLAKVERSSPGFKRDSEHVKYIVPAIVKKAIEPCLSPNPKGRPPAGPLHRVALSAKDERTQWTYWNWDQTIAMARAGFLQPSYKSWHTENPSSRSGDANMTIDDDLVVVRPNIDWE